LGYEEKILELAYETRNEISKPNSSATAMVRRCYSLSQVTKKDGQWIRNELEGYQQEQRQNLPPYRIVKVLRGRSSSGTRVMEDYRVLFPVANIERGASKGLGIFLPSKDVIRSGSEQQVTIESIGFTLTTFL
jgi:hypothetical protein